MRNMIKYTNTTISSAINSNGSNINNTCDITNTNNTNTNNTTKVTTDNNTNTDINTITTKLDRSNFYTVITSNNDIHVEDKYIYGDS